MSERSFAVGADIGGSHITAALVDTGRRQFMGESLSRKSVSPDASVHEIISAWSECIGQALRDSNTKQVCLAIPGPFDYEAGVCLIKDQSKYPGLYGLNVKDLLAAQLGISTSDIFLFNDAACFLQGEVFSGSASGFNRVIGVTLGTGLGTAVYENGVAHSADLWNLEFRGSIAEEFISSRWFVRAYEHRSGKAVRGVRELAEAFPADAHAQALFAEFGDSLGEFLNTFIQMVEPQAVVIGGNIAQSFDLFAPQLSNTIQDHSVRIFKSMHGEHAALIGAVSSWYNSTTSNETHSSIRP